MAKGAERTSTLFFRDDVGNIVVMRRIGETLPFGVVIPGGSETTMREDALLLDDDELPPGFDPIGPGECLRCFDSQGFLASMGADGSVDLPTEGAMGDGYVADA